ncbi:MAG: DUF4331 domain-containing protein [Candidatus Limnocylindrales bacterium]
MTTVLPVAGSSHREAPYIAGDPAADNTDVYAFVTPDDPSTVTIIANFIPVQEPAGGPNFFNFDPSVRYEIHVDYDGSGGDDVTYQFKFRDQIQNKKTFLYNTGPITSLTDPDFNYRQRYSVTRIDDDGDKHTLGSGLRTPPANIGPRSTPGYDALAAMATYPLKGGGQVFAGQRDDPFFVDTGSIFDLLGLRPFNGAHAIPLDTTPGVDGLSGFDVNTIAIRVPIKHLTVDGKEHKATERAATIGIWASTSRQKNRQIRSDGTVRNSGPWVQVSRLGNPLINEVLIPLGVKDYWNRQQPKYDSRFAKYVLAPEPAKLINVLYPTLPDIKETNRTDLITVLMTGVPGLNHTGMRKMDLLRLNTGLKPQPNGACYHPSLAKPVGTAPSRLGVLDGDLCGFPNGRRLADDVTDIEIRAIAEGYGTFLATNFGLPNKTPNNMLGDGVDTNDTTFMTSFPFVASPFDGYAHPHDHGHM